MMVNLQYRAERDVMLGQRLFEEGANVRSCRKRKQWISDQLFKLNFAVGGESMIGRQYRNEAIMCQGMEVEVVDAAGERPKADVSLAIADKLDHVPGVSVVNLDFDSRVPFRKRGEHIWQNVAGHRRHTGDDDPPALQHGLIARFDDAGFDFVESALGVAEKPLALGGKANASRRPVKQRDSQGLFKIADVRAERGLRQVQLL